MPPPAPYVRYHAADAPRRPVAKPSLFCRVRRDEHTLLSLQRSGRVVHTLTYPTTEVDVPQRHVAKTTSFFLKLIVIRTVYLPYHAVDVRQQRPVANNSCSGGLSNTRPYLPLRSGRPPMARGQNKLVFCG